jgi:hypothetical protein
VNEYSLTKLRKEIIGVLNDAEKDPANKHQLMRDAAKTLADMAGQGGSLRTDGENLLIELIEQFDSTRGDNPWPLSAWMQKREGALGVAHVFSDTMRAIEFLAKQPGRRMRIFLED